MPGESSFVHDAPTGEAIRRWLVLKISELLGLDPDGVDVREPFASYGLTSVQAVGLSGELQDWLRRPLPASLVYEYPTVEALARHLTGGADASESPAAPLAGRANGREPIAINGREPIAIIGLGCRFPGAENPQSFWRMLRDGVDAITEVPADRWSLSDFFDPDPSAPGKTDTRWGGFIRQPRLFDPHFFGISPREAARIDPQQRLLLEVAWEALEDAGLAAERLAGTATAVFVGISTNDYSRLQMSDPRLIDAYAGTGNALSIAANRLSYVFDFRGPSVAVDTACSSSLVAVHLACQSLWQGESSLALAGGVNLILSPALAINFTKSGAMASDGRCKTFDARADGYVRSEGAGVVVLKPLSQALADGDPVYAVVRGTAANQDGRTNGLMAPSRQSQEAVLREAYGRAGVSPGSVQYVEAHGTGTLLGDPIEAKALGAVLSAGRAPGDRCAVGSVKTNVGHLEAAAGVAGLIKVALALRNRQLPPSLHFLQPNPHIPFVDLPLRVQQTLTPWPGDGGPALAGVSSFGFGGTNAHVVLESAPPRESDTATPEPAEARTDGPHLLPLSAKSPEALSALADAYRELLAADPEAPLRDLCYTAGVRRSHHDFRQAVVGATAAELAEGLAAFGRGEAHPGLNAGRLSAGRRMRPVFVFPGQGSQWVGMGRELLEREPAFRQTIELCEEALGQFVDWSLTGQLRGEGAESRCDEIDVIQPVIFAVQIALAAVWRSWGVEPAAVVGQSMGEVAAAHVGGALSLRDALRVICRRSRLLKRASGRGSMAAVELSLEQCEGLLAGYEDRLSVAVSSGPASTVLSGDPAALGEVLALLEERNVFARLIKVDVASHSPQMDPLRDDLLAALEGLQPRRARVPVYSTVTGEAVRGLRFDAAYWWRNLREPVLFAPAVRRLVESQHEVFIEISPHPVLSGAIRQVLQHAGTEGSVLPSLRREEGERAVMLGSLGALYAQGYPVDWARLYAGGGRCVSLPSYPWQREPCWMTEAEEAVEWERPARAGGGAGRHPLLGRHLRSAAPTGESFWELEIDRRRPSYLEEHRVQGAPVVPAAFYVEMALAAGREVFGAGGLVLRDVAFDKALFLPEEGTRTLQLVLTPEGSGEASFRLYGLPPLATEGGQEDRQAATLHASGRVRRFGPGAADAPARPSAPAEIQARCAELVEGDWYYRRLGESGLDYGPAFRGLERIWRRDGEALGAVRVEAVEAVGASGTYLLHPSALDACWQVLGAALPASSEGGGEGTYLPVGVEEIEVKAPVPARLWSHALLRAGTEAGALVGDVRLLDEAGRTIAEVRGLRLASLDASLPCAVTDDLDEWLYELQWQPLAGGPGSIPAVTERPDSEGAWLILADRGGVGEALGEQLGRLGEKCVLAYATDGYEEAGGDRFGLDAASGEDFVRLLARIRGGNRPPYRGILHLWGLDTSAEAGPRAESFESADESGESFESAESLEEAQTPGCLSVLHLLRALNGAGWPESPRLWLVTRGAQPAGPSEGQLAVAQAPLWGLARTLSLEHPELDCVSLDLDPGAPGPEADAAGIFSLLWSAGDEDQLAVRGSTVYAPRMAPRGRAAHGLTEGAAGEVGAQAPLPPVSPQATYLITGGLGGLGLTVARWLVGEGARHLALVGRRGAQDGADEELEELRGAGAEVHVMRADVANRREVAGVLGEIERRMPPLKGVVHAAGVLDDGLLLGLDRERLLNVMRPKIGGAWNLHELLADRPLDFFLFFSSAASIIGSPGQGNYAAANAFLDALAHLRRSQGLPAMSINWGPWARVGLAARPDRGGRLSFRGVGSIEPEQGTRVLSRLFDENPTQVCVLPADWPRLRRSHPRLKQSPLLALLPREAGRAEAPADGADGKGRLPRDLLSESAAPERLALVEAHLCEQVAHVLRLSPSRVDPLRPLNTMGLDSLMAAELKNRVEVSLGVSLPLVSLLKGPSISELSALFLEQLTAGSPSPRENGAAEARAGGNGAAGAEGPAGGLHAADAQRLLEQLDQLSDEEVELLLKGMSAEKWVQQ